LKVYRQKDFWGSIFPELIMSRRRNNNASENGGIQSGQISPVDTFVNAEGVELPLLMTANEREASDGTPTGSTTVVSMHDELITIYHPPRHLGIHPTPRPATSSSTPNTMEEVNSNNVMAPEPPPPARSYYSLDAYLVPREARNQEADGSSTGVFIRNNPQKETYTTSDGYVCYPDRLIRHK
jgi:hypothetical protein